jgi:hypothetical protein
VRPRRFLFPRNPPLRDPGLYSPVRFLPQIRSYKLTPIAIAGKPARERQEFAASKARFSLRTPLPASHPSHPSAAFRKNKKEGPEWPPCFRVGRSKPVRIPGFSNFRLLASESANHFRFRFGLNRIGRHQLPVIGQFFHAAADRLVQHRHLGTGRDPIKDFNHVA